MHGSGPALTIDARMQAALARLTENEKECLRRRLQQQTAKEMALELGVSPHAVEKRLKMARTKLGLSSSLEAARLLAATEGYQQTGPQTADLAPTRGGDQPARRHRLAGGLVMGLGIVAALAVTFQLAGGTDDPAADAPAASSEVDAVAAEDFKALDVDRSGFVEAEEIPAPFGAGTVAVAASDANSDGRLSLAEYRAWARQIAEEQARAGQEVGVSAGPSLPPGHVMPSEAELVHMTQTTFHHVDADSSGYIEGMETPITPPKGPQPVFRRDEQGNAVPTGETVVHDENELRAQFYQRADKDGDGRVSYPEFHRWAVPNLVRSGIPAAWREDIRRWMSPEG